MVSSTSAGRGAEAEKARLPLRAARWAGLFSDRIRCCRSIFGALDDGDGLAAVELDLDVTMAALSLGGGAIS